MVKKYQRNQNYFCYYLRLCVIKYQGMLLDLILYSNINKFIMNIFIDTEHLLGKS